MRMSDEAERRRIEYAADDVDGRGGETMKAYECMTCGARYAALPMGGDCVGGPDRRHETRLFCLGRIRAVVVAEGEPRQRDYTEAGR